ncbi:hypothetical protein BWR17_19165 (plasmid) [Phaeobacter inhibens]|uniref:NADPH:quinone reductase n=1 Tax=Phaeobacter inhibens TaxID=221822 RepID=UPI000971B1A8|nr:NADPH:quinone reductase [Phaeobacter inhibens]APX18012.1 hypothetical protein BWR17_19165 [Phaeobacter inhibens]
MKSAIAFGQGAAKDSFRIEDRPVPQPGPGDVRVRIHASGINPSDYKVRSGAQGPLPDGDVIPHSDGAGVIEAVGVGVDANRVGQRVWLYNANRTEDGLAQGNRGTAAEEILIASKYAAPLPDGVSFETGAGLGVPAMTAHRALTADGSIEGQWVLVTGGAGAVGLSAIALGKHLGANIITTVSSEEKAAAARAAGADHIINYRDENLADAILRITGGQKIDRIVDVALSDHMEGASAYLKPGGVVAHYATTDPAAPLAYRSLLVNNTVLRFVFVYAIDQDARDLAISDINACLEAGGLSGITHKSFPLDEIVNAHDYAEAGGFIGKVLLTA